MGTVMAIIDRVASVELTEDAVEVLNSVREAFENLLNEVEDSLPDSREKSLVVTNIEQAFLWAQQTVKVNDVP